MIIVFLKTIVYFFLSLIYFYSITGYGKLLVNSNSSKLNRFNFFELSIFGIIFQLIFGYFVYLTVGTNFYINIVLLLIGLILFFFYKRELNQVHIKYIISLLFVTFTVILISKLMRILNLPSFFSE